MKLYAIIIYYRPSAGGSQVHLLRGAYDLQTFSFFQRGSVQEFMIFTGKIIVERSVLPSRSSIKENEYLLHVFCRADGLACATVADAEYPQRVAQTMMSKLLDEFSQKVPPSQWQSLPEGQADFLKQLETYLAKYQNPHQADAMTRVQDEIDETKIVLHQTIQQVLERGEKLDDLVEKSEGLSSQSKMFYKSARKMNKCCTWM